MQASEAQNHNNPKFNLNVLLLAPIITLILLVFILRKRSRQDLSVNCWFCNFNLRVPHGNENCFHCPRCDQYNGFNEDGDYNKLIPAQRNEDLNYPITGGPVCAEYLRRSWSNGLCSQCNHNQAVKIRLLASFQPILISNEDAEISAYVSHLEHLYKLCWRCKERVRAVLDEQDAELAPLLPQTNPCSIIDREPISSGTTSWTRRVITCLAFLVELLGLCCSFVLLLNHPRLAALTESLSNAWALVPQELRNEQVICLAGFLSSAVATLMNVKQKGKRNSAVSLALWMMSLAWLTYGDRTASVINDQNSLLLVAKEGTLGLSVALILVCFAGLLKLVTFKHTPPRIRKRILKKDYSQEGASETSSTCQDWVFSGDTRMGQPPTFTHQNSSLKEATPAKGPKLTQAFGKMHITFSNSHEPAFTEQTFGHEFASGFVNQGIQNQLHGGRPVLRPAQFLRPSSESDSVSQSSWVAGGFWALSSAEHPVHQQSVRPGFGGVLTPPPSIDGSQNSQTGQSSLLTFLNTHPVTRGTADTVRRRY